MKIDHLAIYADNIELLREFYTKYFECKHSSRYENKSKKFTSYFLYFDDETTRLEIMHIPDLKTTSTDNKITGLAHFAISTGGKKQVNALTERLRKDGYKILSEPRTTGDGYYESAVEDPEGNYVEITE